jgi:DNA-binding MarR family transcriptional regulator
MAEKATSRGRSLSLYEGEQDVKLRTWVELARAFQLIQRRVTSLVSGHGLTLPQFDVLATLRFGEGLTQQELARRLLVTKGNVCGVIDRLEGLGWVERRPDANDRRANRLHLTAGGRRKIDSVLPEHEALVADAMRVLSAADAKALRALLGELARANDDAT